MPDIIVNIRSIVQKVYSSSQLLKPYKVCSLDNQCRKCDFSSNSRELKNLTQGSYALFIISKHIVCQPDSKPRGKEDSNQLRHF